MDIDMDCFNKAVLVILEHEGGFSNHEADPGGATNFGISLRWLKTQGLYGDLDDDGKVDIEDIKAIDIEIATRIYRDKWWNKYHYDRFIDCSIATKVFDISVNMGGRRAHKILQQAINYLGGNLVIDGIIGPITVKSANIENPGALLDEIRKEQKRFYLSLIAKRPAMAVFRRGWLRRAAA